MGDIATLWDPVALVGDWAVAPDGLAAGQDLATAVVISLFTDAPAGPDDEIPDGSGDRRGFWGDAEAPEGPIGSRLWLLAREKQVEGVRVRAEGYAREALAWLTADGVAARVDVAASWGGIGRLDLAVTVYRRDGTAVALNFAAPWGQLAPA